MCFLCQAAQPSGQDAAEPSTSRRYLLSQSEREAVAHSLRLPQRGQLLMTSIALHYQL